MFGKARAPAPYTDRWWRTSDGLKLHARDYAPASGDAKLGVICLHGLTRNARDFEDAAPAIASWGRRVLALDMRGRGQSDRDPSPMNYHPGTYAMDVAGLMADLGLARAHFVGTSMGGLITMTLATVRPDLVGDVVLNDIGPDIAAGGLARIGAYVGRAAKVRSWKEAAAYAQEILGHAHPGFTARDWDRSARRLFREGAGGRPVLDYDPRIAEPIQAAAGGPTVDLWPYYDSLVSGRNLLIIRGATSDVLEPATLKRMRDLEPKALVAEVPDTGHAPTLDEPRAREALEQFLKRAA